MSSINTILGIGIVILFCSCERFGIEKIYDPPNYLHFGIVDTNYLIMNEFSPSIILYSGNCGMNKEIDINADKNIDIRFSASYFKFPSTNSTFFNLLNDSLEITYRQIVDTVYFYIDTIKFGTNVPVYFNSRSDFYSIGSHDSITSINNPWYPDPFNYGDTLFFTNSNNFIDQRVGILSSEVAGSNDLSDSPFGPDKPYHNYRYGLWHNSGEKYLCFRLTTDGGYRYGWFLIKVEGDGKLTIYEYAITKEYSD